MANMPKDKKKCKLDSAVSKTLDFSEVSTHAKASTRNEPNFASLHQLALIKREQIQKANAFLKIKKEPKYASNVLATLCSMGIVLVKPNDTEPNNNIFF